MSAGTFLTLHNLFQRKQVPVSFVKFDLEAQSPTRNRFGHCIPVRTGTCDCLTITTLVVISAGDNFDDIFFLFFFREIGFGTSCKLSHEEIRV